VRACPRADDGRQLLDDEEVARAADAAVRALDERLRAGAAG
jgi:hypothetical protein